MHQRIYTIEELAENGSFINFCTQRNAKDTAWWQHYIAQHPDQLPLINAARQLVITRHRTFAAQRAWNKRRLRQRLAFLIILLIIAGVATWYFTAGKPAPDSKLRLPGTKYTVHKGTVGTRTIISLPDSTTVILNADSRLLVPEQFPTRSREVLLNGEAWFQVTPATQPFIVKTDKLTSTVLGTSFRIRSFEAQQGATVYLLEGKIRVAKSYHSESDNQPEILERGQMILANKEIDLMEKETFEPATQEQWHANKAAFKEENFMSLMRKLEDWYAVEIIVKGEIPPAAAGQNIVIDHTPLQQVLDQLSKTTGCSYKLKDNTATIRF